MKDNNKIVMLPRELLHQHPDNPRKDLGDLTELRESIREHGIMQNLTVVPETEEQGDGYRILIGHRRFAASEGILDELPCVVAKELSDKDQVGIMLCENIQRSDLTFVEQAHGFQMMMDLGETVESISQKTGFSGATIKHRLEIAKLSTKTINQEREWQLSISDLIELEKIPNVKDREKILKDSTDPMNLRYRVRNQVTQMIYNKNIKKAQEWFKKLKINQDQNSSMWQTGIEKVCEFELGSENPKDFTLEKLEKLLEKKKSLFWQTRYGNGIVLFTKSKKKVEKKTAAELQRAEKTKQIKKINSYVSQFSSSFGRFIFDLPLDLAKKVAAGLHNEADIWRHLVIEEASIGGSYYLVDFIQGYEERKKFWEEIYPTWPMALQMLLILNTEVDKAHLIGYDEEVKKTTIDLLKFMISSLTPYGYNLPEDIPQGLLNPRDEIYSFLKEDE